MQPTNTYTQYHCLFYKFHASIDFCRLFNFYCNLQFSTFYFLPFDYRSLCVTRLQKKTHLACWKTMTLLCRGEPTVMYSLPSPRKRISQKNPMDSKPCSEKLALRASPLQPSSPSTRIPKRKPKLPLCPQVSIPLSFCLFPFDSIILFIQWNTSNPCHLLDKSLIC